MKVALNEKRKKIRGFSFSINIANFEEFLLVFKLTKNLFYLKSESILTLQSENIQKLLILTFEENSVISLN